ncbi:MAG: hypothetical protein IKH65_02565 [Clostridia bacterium]|nr:hypothetical protein [Clostridia bacterium]
MNTPRKCRRTGYVILFTGVVLFALGLYPRNFGGRANVFLVIVSLIIIAASVMWMVKKVRCPHCGALLHLKLYNIDVCPYCGKNTDNS